MSGAAVRRSHLAGSMHRFSSRSDESADLTRPGEGYPLVRVDPRKCTVRYVEEADRVQRSRCAQHDG